MNSDAVAESERRRMVTEADERRGAVLGGAEGASTGDVRTTGVGDLKTRASMREMSVR